MSRGDPASLGRLRVTVDGVEPLVLDLEPRTDADRPAAAEAAHEVISDTERELATDPPFHLALLSGPSPSSGGPARYEVVVEGWRFEVEVESVARADLRARASRAAQRGLGSGRQLVRAQIPGRIMALAVAEGAVVEAGQRLLSVEAMKMENAVIAPWAGTIAHIGVVAGQTVERGDVLVVIE